LNYFAAGPTNRRSQFRLPAVLLKGCAMSREGMQS
jgi:hypothetical protein